MKHGGSLFVALVLQLFLFLSAHSERRPLGPDEAYVLIKLVYEGTSRITLRFAEYDQKDSFSVRSYKARHRLIRVKAGHYYLQRAKSPFTNVINPKQERPDSTRQAIAVPAGAIIYIGDWLVTQNLNVNTQLDFDVQFGNETIYVLAARDTWVTEIPLRVSMIGKPLLDVAWD